MSQTVPNPSTNDATQNDDEIDLIALLLTLLRGWKTILACALLGLALGFTYSRYVQPTYQTDALIQIDEKSQGIAALGSNISELVGETKSQAETERELIKSRMVLEPVINKLNLDIKVSDAELGALDRIAQSAIPTQSSNEKGVFLETEEGLVHIANFEVPRIYENKPFTITKTDQGFDLSIEIEDKIEQYQGNVGTKSSITTPEGEIKILVQSLPAIGHTISLTKKAMPTAINDLNSALSVTEKGKQTGIVQLTLTGDDQRQVSRVLANVVQSYVDQNLARGSEQTTTTIQFMESQIPQLKQKLEEAEQAFNKFREQYGTIDVSKESEILLSESAEIERQLSELKLKQAELLTYYTPEHPLVIQINEQLAVLNSRRQEIKTTVSNMPEVQREFLQLSQDMEINREIYLTMLKNYEQLKIARAGEIGYVRVVDTPINTYEPIAPKKLQIWVLALLLGTMLGTLLVLARSLLRSTVKDPERLEAKTGVPVIASIPRSKKSFRISRKGQNNRRLLTHIEHDGLSYEGIKSLRTALMFSMPSVTKANIDSIESHYGYLSGGKVIVITGEAPAVGKSFISSNLAETFTQLNKRVLIIDSDMRRGELHRVFNMSPDAGLGDYLTSDHPDISDYLHPTGIDLLNFMPRGRQPRNPGSLLSSDKFKRLMKTVVAMYDYIIIDTPPILAVSDAAIISKTADKVLMVTRFDKSIEGQVTYAVSQMQKSNVRIDGIVLNDVVQGVTSKYSYHYNYGYGNKKD